MIYHIYCDESCQNKDRFMVIGGLILEQKDISRFNRTMQAFRAKENMHAELKWTKVTNQKLLKYQTFIDYFFALNNTDIIHFHSIIVDNHQVDHKRFSAGDKEDGFYKFYYQLLLHKFGKKYYEDSDTKFIVHLDQRRTKYKLSDLLRILNNGMHSRYGITTSPFISIEPTDSKLCELIQIDDILIGAVGFEKNGRHLLADSRYAKKAMIAYIAEKAGLLTLANTTRFGRARFTLWNFRLTK